MDLWTEWQAIREWSDEQRLRWLVEGFLRQDLKSESPEARTALRKRLRALTPAGVQGGYVAGDFGGGVLQERDPGDLEELTTLQEVVRGAVQALLAGHWTLPRPQQIVVDRYLGDEPTKPAIYRERWIPEEATIERDALLFALSRLILAAGARLYSCRARGCGRLFVRYRKQLYCSKDCTRKVLHRRKAERRKLARAERRDRRAKDRPRKVTRKVRG